MAANLKGDLAKFQETKSVSGQAWRYLCLFFAYLARRRCWSLHFALLLLLAAVSAAVAVFVIVVLPAAVMTCAGVVQFVLCLQILFALLFGGIMWAVLNDKIPAKPGTRFSN